MFDAAWNSLGLRLLREKMNKRETTKSTLTRTQKRDQTQKKARKIMANPMKWKRNVRKPNRQILRKEKGGNVPERRVKTLKNCNLQCKFKCGEKSPDTEPSDIHDSFYSLGIFTEKRCFLINTTGRLLTAKSKRLRTEQRVKAEEDAWMEDEDEENNLKNKRKIKSSRKKFSFKYFFVKGEKIQVCKSFYSGILSTSQKPVYTAHSTKNVETNTPTQNQRGKNGNSRRVPKETHFY
ncbi:hypothetical protein AVEN_148212-1 [Araneus ventricosus]|uniref:Uncharacterized protein n=1 Tax=Araneus ventricosus TaxID=182803 RepID=A0A4Y2DCV5_ARAVE|nr:hypothetical protein AVEN_148212-1 [Araneus ventricosus]